MATDEEEIPEIHQAVIEGNRDRVQSLLDSGTDIETRDEEDKTALFLAAQQGEREVAQLLMDRGADKETRSNTGYTPLHISSENGCIDVVRLLLQRKVDPNARDMQWGSTPMICASFWGYHEIVSLLLKKGADPSIEAYFGYTPLGCASVKGHTDVVRTLLEHKTGVNIECKTNNGYSPLLHAASNAYVDTVRVLLDHHADITATDTNRIGVLHVVAAKGDAGLLNLLIKKRLNVQVTDVNGNTPLHSGTEGNNIEVVKILLKSGCSINTPNNNGHTSFHIAAEKGFSDIIRCFIQAGGDANLKTKDHDKPIDLAYLAGHASTVEVLKLVSKLSDNITEREKHYERGNSNRGAGFAGRIGNSHGPRPAPRKNTDPKTRAGSLRSENSFQRQESETSVTSSDSDYIDMKSNVKSEAGTTPMYAQLMHDPEEIDALKQHIQVLEMKQKEQAEALQSMGPTKYSRNYTPAPAQIPAPSPRPAATLPPKTYNGQGRTYEGQGKTNIPVAPKSPKKSRNPFKYFMKKHNTNKPSGAAAATSPKGLNRKKSSVSTPKVLQQLSISGDTKELVTDVYMDFDRLFLGDLLGKGNFGRVYHGSLKTGSEYEKVAVKTTKYKSDEIEIIEDFLKEALMMKDFKHAHVLSLIGISFDLEGNPLVILPYMAHGNLRAYICDPQRSMSIQQLLQLSTQVARGMEYLAVRKFIHRDLAARNCMIDQAGDNVIVKVADFGLSHDIFAKDYYRISDRDKPLPVRWMAPEALKDDIFLLQSDVWSFGVLLWEVLTRGATPYSDIENHQLQQHIFRGLRLEKPKYCPDDIYGIMQSCWNMDPKKRPSFTDLVTDMEDKMHTHMYPVDLQTGQATNTMGHKMYYV